MGERDAQVVIGGQRLDHQAVQQVVIELTPERSDAVIRGVDRRLRFDKGRRGLHRRAVIVGPDRAGRQGRRDRGRADEFTNLSTVHLRVPAEAKRRGLRASLPCPRPR